MRQINFDFSFLEEVIEYLKRDRTDEDTIVHLSQMPAVDHLVRHSNNFSFDNTTRIELVKNLLNPLEKSIEVLPETTTAADRLRNYLADNDDWMLETEKLLPEEHNFAGVNMYLTFGYDVGVVSDSSSASLNLAHPLIRKQPEDAPFYLIHELHHTGYLNYQDLSGLGEIRSRGQLVDLVQSLTHLEGLGMYAPMDIRKNCGALHRDPKYKIIGDEARIARLEQKFWQQYDLLAQLPEQVNREQVSQTLESFGEPESLFHLVGCRLVQRLDSKHGRDTLVETIMKGPKYFFSLL